MSKNQLTIYVALGSLSVAFVAVSFMHWMFKDNPSLIRSKFKVGSLILLFSGYLGGCDKIVQPMCYSPADRDTDTETDTDTDTESDSESGISCYSEPLENEMFVEIEGGQTETITLDLQENNVLHGHILASVGQNFSFRIIDQTDEQMQAEPLSAADGEYDDYTDEEFEIHIDMSLETGEYTLHLYVASLETVASEDTWPARTYQLLIENTP